MAAFVRSSSVGSTISRGEQRAFETADTQDALIDNENPDFSDPEGHFFEDGLGDVPGEGVFHPIPIPIIENDLEVIQEEDEDKADDMADEEADKTAIKEVEQKVIETEIEAAQAAVAEHNLKEDVPQDLAGRVKARVAEARRKKQQIQEDLARKAAAAIAERERVAVEAKAAKAAQVLAGVPAGPPSVWTGRTIAGKLIYQGVRLEHLNPDSQFSKIHGDKSDLNSCALCGFPYSKRVSKRKANGGISISYDHFIPVNFAAVVFRVAVTAGRYTQKEFALMGLIGDMVCWHCNYEKSQRMFLTCPNKKDRSDFLGLRPNINTIRKFFNDMLVSTRSDGYDNSDSVNTTLIRCIGVDSESQLKWVEQRVAATMKRAQNTCDAIIANVDYFKVRARLAATKNIVAVVDLGLQQDARYSALDAKHKSRYRCALIAKRFADAELLLPKPWNFPVEADRLLETPNPPIPVPDIVISIPKTPSGPMRREPQTKRKGSFSPFGGGGRRKTHRRRRLPKLV